MQDRHPLSLGELRRKRLLIEALPSAARCRSIQDEAAVTQADLAAAMKVHVNTVGRWERGERTPTGSIRAAYVELLNALQEPVKP
jgi:DNA-binding transcriptional regulator YiaG